ncbi:MAG: precorrin-8X methylmutase [Firmicutes bacterium]|nr:precorrin-8X methylmutase [Bacillota bacterium]
MSTYQYVRPADIEKESMRIIEAEMGERGIEVPAEHLAVVKRVIHTTADFDYGRNLKFTEHAVERSIAALQEGGCVFITDTNMALSGISKPSLKKLDAEAVCYMADPQIMRQAKEEGTTRATASMRRGAAEHPDAIFVSGNAPTALITLSEMIREGLRPTLIVAVPVGFVNVVESKQELFELCAENDIPAIAAFGRKGGSNVAASICNALLYSAVGTIDPMKRGWQK